MRTGTLPACGNPGSWCGATLGTQSGQETRPAKPRYNSQRSGVRRVGTHRPRQGDRGKAVGTAPHEVRTVPRRPPWSRPTRNREGEHSRSGAPTRRA